MYHTPHSESKLAELTCHNDLQSLEMICTGLMPIHIAYEVVKKKQNIKFFSHNLILLTSK